ncbi:hypothetical protein Nepgr_025708 [Nepenthes gracilis]|uniref:Nudix hydrolase domain-containing protein n=1 Tax=Nepenthes gracilis TaxID=150966 RepID=A0AAD3Y1D8_NEPGR|nr:hypothetical protein Nepgr_025708 [Nepenthes gracilis]
MATIVARTGRCQQRYEDNHRLVSGCIPYRLWNKDEENSSFLEDRIEVLMISSPDRDDLVFPKGGWEDDETVHQAACREALEEAGVKGILNEKPLGVWEFRSKSSQKNCSLEGGCRGYMFALEVTEELDAWPEQENHDRKWLSIEEAFKLCRYEWMREALERFLKLISEEQNSKMTGEVMDSTMSVSAAVPSYNTCQSPDGLVNFRAQDYNIKKTKQVMDTTLTRLAVVPDCHTNKAPKGFVNVMAQEQNIKKTKMVVDSTVTMPANVPDCHSKSLNRCVNSTCSELHGISPVATVFTFAGLFL